MLFDEIEKASKEVIRTLLNVLDTGELSLANGQKNINFKNSIIIMTSNLGFRDILNNNKERTSFFRRKTHEQKILELLEQRFEPEFINCIDRKIIYKKLMLAMLFKLLNLSYLSSIREFHVSLSQLISMKMPS
ncbi:ATP-dependent Clp protease ATP-binding subunit ClpA [Providencia alcalifaciens]|nr:ATP-dependent Clp protease ATP-binding subunit ClpA [Providencia alcalifaciens]